MLARVETFETKVIKKSFIFDKLSVNEALISYIFSIAEKKKK